jgi:hypothetical protein
MVGGLGALGALGSIAGGVGQGLDAESRRRLLEQQAAQIAQQQTGNVDAGNALSGAPMTAPQQQGGMLARLGSMFGSMFGGGGGGQGQPQGAPQPPPIGRAGPPQMGALPPQGGAPQPPPQPSPQPSPQGGGQPPGGAPITKLDFPTILQLFQQKGLTGARLMAALNAVAPMMNLQAQQQYKQAMMSVAQQKIPIEQQRADADTKRAATGAENVDSEVKSRDAASEARKQRLGLEAQKLKDSEAKAASDASIKTLSQWQSANKDAENERQRAVSDLNTAYTNTSDPDQEGTIKMLKENLASADARIKALHDARPNVQDDVGDKPHPTGAGGGGGKSTDRVDTGRPQEVTVGGVKYKWTGKGDYDDKSTWTPVQ